MNAAYHKTISVADMQPVVDESAQPLESPSTSRTGIVRPLEKTGGSPSQYWLHDEDRILLRKLAAWLAVQGERPTDSLVIRSVLGTAACGPELLNAYRQAAQLDGRLKGRKTRKDNVVPLPKIVPKMESVTGSHDKDI